MHVTLAEGNILDGKKTRIERMRVDIHDRHVLYERGSRPRRGERDFGWRLGSRTGAQQKSCGIEKRYQELMSLSGG
jgi:hypothetical protein